MKLKGKLKDLLVLDHKEPFVGYGFGYGCGFGSEPQNQTLTKDEWLNAGAEVL